MIFALRSLHSYRCHLSEFHTYGIRFLELPVRETVFCPGQNNFMPVSKQMPQREEESTTTHYKCQYNNSTIICLV